MPLLNLLVIALLGCAASKDARPSPGVEQIPPSETTGAVAVTQDAQAVPTAASLNSSATPAASSTGTSVKDSTAKDPPVTVPSVKGRTKKDSHSRRLQQIDS